MKRQTSYALIAVIIVGALIIGFALAVAYPLPPPKPRLGQTEPLPPPPGDNPEYYTWKTVF